MILLSRFKFWSFLPLGILIVVSSVLIIVGRIAYHKYEIGANVPPVGVIAFFTLFGFVWIWLVFGELRTKVIKVWVSENEIISRNYFGLGRKKIYEWFEFEGYTTSLLPSKFDTYEYLYLIIRGYKVIKVSEYYHSNFKELKEEISKHATFIGNENFSLLREIKEIFM